jgi:hypothetical protein
MKQATVAGITVAMGPVLQGCGDPDPPSRSCAGLSANDCITNNEASECAWDLETSEEACILQDDFDQALFNATKPMGDISQDAAQDSDFTFEGCAEYDAVPAQRCLSQCEWVDDYKMPGGESNIRLDDLETDFMDFRQQKMNFFLPQIVDEFENLPENFTDQGADATYADLVRECSEPESTGFQPDWTPYGDLSDHRLQMTAQLLGVIGNLQSWDARLEVEANEGGHEIAFDLTVDLTLGGKTLKDWVEGANLAYDTYDPADMVTWLGDNIFADKNGTDFVAGLWDRFSTLDKLHKIAGQNTEITIVKADLDANSFMLYSAFDACSGDRNCGVDFASGQCAELEDYCAQWTSENCPDMPWDEQISMPKPLDDNIVMDPAVPNPRSIGGGKVGDVEGYVYYEDDESAKCASYMDEQDGYCGLPDKFVTCETIGYPTQVGNEDNVCIKYDLTPVQWNPPVFDDEGELVELFYDVEELSTFALVHEVVQKDGSPLEVGENPRGCLNLNDESIPEATYSSSFFGYTGPVCTYPAGWDCTINYDPDTEPGCNVTVPEAPLQGEICAYQAASMGECVTSDQFYAKYFDSATDEPSYVSVTVEFADAEPENDMQPRDGDELIDDELIDGDDFDGSKIG